MYNSVMKASLFRIFLMFLVLNVVFTLGCALVPSRNPAGEVVIGENGRRLENRNDQVDLVFIEKSLGHRYEYVRPQIADGEPNCVATALRAGRYLPSFTLSGTDEFYDLVLPHCFEKREGEVGSPGDLGVVRFNLGTFSTVAHMVLLLENGVIFEKPSPQLRHVFQKSRLEPLQKGVRDKNLSLEIWTYKPKSNCPLVAINDNFQKQPDESLLRRISAELDQRIYSQDWKSSSRFTKKELVAAASVEEKKLMTWFRRLPGGYKQVRDGAEYYRRSFALNLIKTAQRIPSSQ